MRMQQNWLGTLAGIGLIIFAGGALAADAPAGAEPKPSGLSSLIGGLKDIQIPSLTGLIQPEKMGMFTDNPCRISDNEGHLLSDNAADRDLLSGNSCDILSNIHLLSDITVTVQITIHHGDATTAKPKNSDAARKTKKAQKDKASRKKKP